MEESREKQEIDVEYAPDSERYWLSLVPVGCRVIEESEMRK